MARAEPLSDAELAQVTDWLDPKLLDLFKRQQPADQRHGLECANRILAEAPDRLDLIPAALLHDVAKRHAHLGPVGRTLATVTGAASLPKPRRWTTYLDHPLLSAIELEAAGADRLTVDFTRNQDASRPSSIDEESWRLLRLGDLEAP